MFKSRQTGRNKRQLVKKKMGLGSTYLHEPTQPQKVLGETTVRPAGEKVLTKETLNKGAPSQRLRHVMDEVHKMAAEGLIAAEDVARIERNVEQAKAAGLFSTGHKLLSRYQFVGIAGRKGLGEGPAEAVYNALLSTRQGQRSLASREAAEMAASIAAAKGGMMNDKKVPAGISSHLDRIMEDKTGRQRTQGLMQAAVAGAIPTAAIVASAAYDATSARRNYRSMMDENPELRSADPQQVERAYRVLKTYAPSMTTDPFVAGSTVKMILEYDAVDPATVRQFQDANKQDTRVVPRLIDAFRQAAGSAATVSGLGGGG